MMLMKIRTCNFADDVLYDADSNTWARVQDGVVTIGINTILAWAFGLFSTVTFKSVGAEVQRGGSLGTLESPLHFDVVRSPLTGVIIEVNQELKASPRTLNKDPYETGWYARIRPSRLDQEVGLLKDVQSATEELDKKIEALKVRCFSEFPDYEMYEIGTECSAVFARLDEILAREPTGTVVHIVSDDPTAGIEMVRWSERTGNALVEERAEGNLMHFLVKKAGR